MAPAAAGDGWHKDSQHHSPECDAAPYGKSPQASTAVHEEFLTINGTLGDWFGDASIGAGYQW